MIRVSISTLGKAFNCGISRIPLCHVNPPFHPVGGWLGQRIDQGHEQQAGLEPDMVITKYLCSAISCSGYNDRGSTLDRRCEHVPVPIALM